MDQREIVFVDANIFLEFFLDNKRAEECHNFLVNVFNNKISAVTSDFIIYTCMLQIQLKLKSTSKMKEFILWINELKINGLNILRPRFKEIYEAIKILENYKLDFDDAFVVSCMINNNITILISLDKDFDKVNIIKRKVP